MARADMDIKWEWPAGRRIESKFLVQVVGIVKESRGFFGIGESPSMADALPDAKVVTARVVKGEVGRIGQTVKMRLPGIEADKLHLTGYAAVGLVERNSICICLDVAPADMTQMERWYEGWSCD